MFSRSYGNDRPGESKSGREEKITRHDATFIYFLVAFASPAAKAGAQHRSWQSQPNTPSRCQMRFFLDEECATHARQQQKNKTRPCQDRNSARSDIQPDRPLRSHSR